MSATYPIQRFIDAVARMEAKIADALPADHDVSNFSLRVYGDGSFAIEYQHGPLRNGSTRDSINPLGEIMDAVYGGSEKVSKFFDFDNADALVDYLSKQGVWQS